jgi:hypothetical protein
MLLPFVKQDTFDPDNPDKMLIDETKLRAGDTKQSKEALRDLENLPEPEFPLAEPLAQLIVLYEKQHADWQRRIEEMQRNKTNKKQVEPLKTQDEDRLAAK